jgi:hypothetical protein
MDRYEYATFLRAQGLRTLEIDGELWVMKRPFFLESIPPHRRIRLTRRGRARLFLHGAAVVRYTCPRGDGSTTCEYICDDRDYDLHSLGHNARNATRQGLNNCVVRQVDFDLLAREGCSINNSVFDRHDRPGPSHLTRDDLWQRYMRLCSRMQDIDAWGVFVEGRLCGFMLVPIIDDYAYTYHPYVMTESLKYRPMNALLFTVTRHLLATSRVSRVSYGLQPIAFKSSLEHFKLSMGFRREPIDRNILISPLARPLLSHSTHRALNYLLRIAPHSLFLHDWRTFSEALQPEPELADSPPRAAA